jgi:hypothetical protein
MAGSEYLSFSESHTQEYLSRLRGRSSLEESQTMKLSRRNTMEEQVGTVG